MSPNPILALLESLDSPEDVVAILIYPSIVHEGADLSCVVCFVDGSRREPAPLETTDLDQAVSWRKEAMNWIAAFRQRRAER